MPASQAKTTSSRPAARAGAPGRPRFVALVTRLCRLHCAHAQCHSISPPNAAPDTMFDAWLARCRHGVFWTIMDDITNASPMKKPRRVYGAGLFGAGLD